MPEELDEKNAAPKSDKKQIRMRFYREVRLNESLRQELTMPTTLKPKWSKKEGCCYHRPHS
jgi:hypothetical protein